MCNQFKTIEDIYYIIEEKYFWKLFFDAGVGKRLQTIEENIHHFGWII